MIAGRLRGNRKTRHKPRPAGGRLLLQHARACAQSLNRMRANPGASVLSVVIIGISLALPAGFYAALENVRQLTWRWDAGADISLFLAPGTEQERAENLARRLLAQTEIATVELITPAAALAEYKKNSGFAAALDALTDNPLPYVLLVQPRADLLSADARARLLARLRELPEVSMGQFDRQWAERLHHIIVLMQRAVVLIAALLAVTVALVVGSATRLTISNQRREIELSKLFGATNAYVSRPFLYTGICYGLGGSLVAWALLVCAVLLLKEPVGTLAALYDSRFSLVALDHRDILGLFLIGAGLGLAGSWLAVRRHLRAIEPG